MTVLTFLITLEELIENDIIDSFDEINNDIINLVFDTYKNEDEEKEI